MKTKKFSVDGTGAWTQDGPWNVLFYENGVDAGGQVALIRIQTPDGHYVDMEAKPGRQVTLDAPASGVVITSLTGNPISGEISLGTGDIRDATLMGEVSVVDGEVAKSMANAAFMAYGAVGGVVGQRAFLEIWNAASTGKNVVVSDVMLASPGIAGVATYGLYLTSALQAGPGVGAASKRAASVGPAVSSALCRGATIAAFGSLVSTLETTTLTINTPFPRVFKQPIILPPGTGLLVASNTPDATLYASAQFTEAAI